MLVQAAVSGQGTASGQLCQEWGHPTIATASTEAKLELARSLGASQAIAGHRQSNGGSGTISRSRVYIRLAESVTWSV